MTQTKTLVRLFKSAASTSFALSALAGGVMLAGGEAKALLITTCDPLSGQLPATCTTSGDPYPGVTFKNGASGTSPTNPGGSVFVNLEQTGLGNGLSQQQIDTDFNPPLTGGPVTSTYHIEALTPDTWFDQVDLSAALFPGSNANVTAVYTFNNGATPSPITLSTGGTTIASVIGKPTKITVVNTYTPGNGSIDNAQNTFRTVPGPLPILGAGAAFGFSRKLRGRIKGARTA